MDEVGGRRERRKVPEAKPVESGEPSELMEVGHGIESAIRQLETRVELAVQRRTMLLVVTALVAVAVFVVGAWMVNDQRQGNMQRQRIQEAVQEIKDCTTPGVDTPCQRRMAAGQVPVLRALSEDNLRASVSVGTCLRAGAPDVEKCALEEFRRRTAKAEADRQAPVPPP